MRVSRSASNCKCAVTHRAELSNRPRGSLTTVHVAGGCLAPSGSSELGAEYLRAELGAPFKLDAADFPLRLSVLSASASARGTDGPMGTEVEIPALYFSFYTEDVDMRTRELMWCTNTASSRYHHLPINLPIISSASVTRRAPHPIPHSRLMTRPGTESPSVSSSSHAAAAAAAGSAALLRRDACDAADAAARTV